MYKISYIANGVDTDFLFVFPFFQNADIKVSVDDVLIGDTQYNVIANNDFSGGTVVFANAPINDSKIDIFRQVSLSRVIDYQPTLKIDPEDLNSDFNFLLAALNDLNKPNIDLAEWQNIHDNVISLINYTVDLIKDKLSGGAVMGLYNNLLNVLDSALPKLINDYGSVTEESTHENDDDYGSL
jgi:hypothetical protein